MNPDEDTVAPESPLPEEEGYHQDLDSSDDVQVTTASGKTFTLNKNTTAENTPPKKDIAQIEREYHPEKPLYVEKEPEKGGFFSFLFELLLIILVVWGIRTFIATPFQVEGHSMDDTLQDGEKIFINKLETYVDGIDRGDIIVFKPPYYRLMPKQGLWCAIKQRFSEETDVAKLCGEEPQHYVKRVIGVSGDTVRIQGGKVFLSKENAESEVLAEPYLNEENTDKTCFHNITCASKYDAEGYDFVVPEGKVFVLGDNRLHSSDSRTALETRSTFNDGTTPEPFVPLENIVGTVKFVLWPPSEWQWFSPSE